MTGKAMTGRTPRMLILALRSAALGAILCSNWLTLGGKRSCWAQQFVAPTALPNQGIPASGPPVLHVAPDGMVHLDGAMAAPGSAYAQQSAVQPGAAGYGGQQAPLWRPFAKDWDELGKVVFEGPVAPHYAHRHGFWGEFLYLRPRDADLTFAIPTDGAVNPVPIGPTGTLTPDFEPAFRAGLNARLNDCGSLVFQYTFVRSETTESTSISAVLGELFPVLLHPGTLNTTSPSQTANATLSIDQNIIDVLFRGMLEGSEDKGARCADATHYFMGARLAQMDQGLTANYTVTGITSVNTEVDFQGAGLSLGLESERYNNFRGFFIYGRGMTHLLAGEFDASFRQQNTFNGLEASTTWTGARIVPVVEAELGVGWTGPRRHVRLSAGYLISGWFNMVTTDEFISATHAFDFSDMSDVMTFDGLTARAEWRF